MNEKSKVIAGNSIYCQHNKQKKGGVLYQLYKIDASKRCLIGGRNETGYQLKFYSGRDSGAVMTDYDILKLLHGDTVNINGQDWTGIRKTKS